MRLAFTVADYVDFYSSEQHATNVGAIFRPDAPSLPAAWRHLPIGYHGRAGTVVVSGTDVVRPSGWRRDESGEVSFGPSRRLDLEAEVGFVVGVPLGAGFSPSPWTSSASTSSVSSCSTTGPHATSRPSSTSRSVRSSASRSPRRCPRGCFRSRRSRRRAYALRHATRDLARPLDDESAQAVGSRPRDGGRDPGHRGVPAALREHVLDRRAAAGATSRPTARRCARATCSARERSAGATPANGGACSSCPGVASGRYAGGRQQPHVPERW